MSRTLSACAATAAVCFGLGAEPDSPSPTSEKKTFTLAGSGTSQWHRSTASPSSRPALLDSISRALRATRQATSTPAVVSGFQRAAS